MTAEEIMKNTRGLFFGDKGYFLHNHVTACSKCIECQGNGKVYAEYNQKTIKIECPSCKGKSLTPKTEYRIHSLEIIGIRHIWKHKKEMYISGFSEELRKGVNVTINVQDVYPTLEEAENMLAIVNKTVEMHGPIVSTAKSLEEAVRRLNNTEKEHVFKELQKIWHDDMLSTNIKNV